MNACALVFSIVLHIAQYVLYDYCVVAVAFLYSFLACFHAVACLLVLGLVHFKRALRDCLCVLVFCNGHCRSLLSDSVFPSCFSIVDAFLLVIA